MKEYPPTRVHPHHWRESPCLSFAGDGLHLDGDPETPEDFSRALVYLESIMAHFQEFGPIEEKTGWDVAYELSYHNAWHQHEVEAERKAGEKQAEYHEISLPQLQALSKRKLLALAESGSEDIDYPIAQFFDQLIEQTVAEEEALNRLTAPAPKEP